MQKERAAGARSSSTLACAGAAALVMATIADAQGTEEQRDKIETFIQQWWSQAGLEAPQDRDYPLTLVDLNDDGVEEALIVFDGPSSCGMRGCSAFVLDLSGDEACSRGDFLAFQLSPGREVTGGWRDIFVGDTRVTFADGHYGQGSHSC